MDVCLSVINQDASNEPLDETSLKKLLLQFEKRYYRNQELRIKYPDQPEKFLDSEVELNDAIQELHIVSTAPELYEILIEMNSVQSVLQLLSHDNTGTSVPSFDLPKNS